MQGTVGTATVARVMMVGSSSTRVIGSPPSGVSARAAREASGPDGPRRAECSQCRTSSFALLPDTPHRSGEILTRDAGEMKGHERVVHRHEEYVNRNGFSTNNVERYFGQL